MKPWIDRYMPAKPFSDAGGCRRRAAGGQYVQVAFIIINVLLVEKAALMVAFQHRKLLFRRTLRMDMARITADHTSELLTHFTHDIECLTAGVRTVFGRAIREPLKILACLVGAAWICWRLFFSHWW